LPTVLICIGSRARPESGGTRGWRIGRRGPYDAWALAIVAGQARFRAATASSRFRDLRSGQPTTRGEYRSSNTARCAQPSGTRFVLLLQLRVLAPKPLQLVLRRLDPALLARLLRGRAASLLPSAQQILATPRPAATSATAVRLVLRCASSASV
jgi:hypothetical protein